MSNVHRFKLEQSIKDNPSLSDDEKQAILDGMRQGVMEAYSPEFIQKLIAKFEQFDDREPTAKVSDIERLEGRLDPMAEDIKRLEGRLDPMAEDIKRLEGRLDPMAEDIKRLEGRLDPMAEDIKRLEGRLEGSSRELQEVKHELKSEIGELRSDVRWIKIIGGAIIAIELLPWLQATLTVAQP